LVLTKIKRLTAREAISLPDRATSNFRKGRACLPQQVPAALVRQVVLAKLLRAVSIKRDVAAFAA
jgi:hypothetical protein